MSKNLLVGQSRQVGVHREWHAVSPGDGKPLSPARPGRVEGGRLGGGDECAVLLVSCGSSQREEGGQGLAVLLR